MLLGNPICSVVAQYDQFLVVVPKLFSANNFCYCTKTGRQKTLRTIACISCLLLINALTDFIEKIKIKLKII